jgi:hypothetical protein
MSRIAQEAHRARSETGQEIFKEIQAIVGIYRGLYHPVQDFVLKHQVAKTQFHLEGDASIIAAGLNETILGSVNHGRRVPSLEWMMGSGL